MDTKINEQYRPGFEAWAREEGYDLLRDGCGFYFHGPAAYAWRVWTASKREASTEPSDLRQTQAEPSGNPEELVRQLRITAGMVTMCERISGVEHISVLNRAANFIEAAGALTDDAKGQTK